MRSSVLKIKERAAINIDDTESFKMLLEVSWDFIIGEQTYSKANSHLVGFSSPRDSH